MQALIAASPANACHETLVGGLEIEEAAEASRYLLAGEIEDPARGAGGDLGGDGYESPTGGGGGRTGRGGTGVTGRGRPLDDGSPAPPQDAVARSLDAEDPGDVVDRDGVPGHDLSEGVCVRGPEDVPAQVGRPIVPGQPTLGQPRLQFVAGDEPADPAEGDRRGAESASLDSRLPDTLAGQPGMDQALEGRPASVDEADQHQVGAVEGVVVDRDGRVTHADGCSVHVGGAGGGRGWLVAGPSAEAR
jgi:hypothetical protein